MNTYPDDASIEVKTHEELRCIRSVLERLLRVMSSAEFVDYQMEKFGKDYHTIIREVPIYTPTTGSTNPCTNCWWTKELKEKYHGTYIGDSPCQWCPHGPKVVC